MSSPTNLTDRISHLRERKGGSDIASGSRTAGAPSAKAKKPNRERQFATDVFMLFAYTLLGIATICQLVLIVWLDIV